VSNGGGKLEVFDGQAQKTYTLRELGLKEYPITRVEVDRVGRIWIVTRDDRSSRVVEYINEFTFSPEGIPSLKSSIKIDGYLNAFEPVSQGRIWAAVDRAFPKPEVTGLNLFDGATLQRISDQGKDLRHVAGTALDQRGRLWVVTRCGSVLIFDSQTWKTILDQEGFTRCDPFEMQGMILDKQDRVWAWNLRGVQILDRDQWILLTPENSGIAGDWAFGVIIEEGDRVWIGSSGGVSLAALSQVRPLPQIVVSWHRTVSYLETWVVGMAWFFPTVILLLWLATYFNLLPGVLGAVVLGLICIGVGVGAIGPGNNDGDRLIVYAGVGGTFIGILCGIIGGLENRYRKRTRSALGVAIAGALLGGAFTALYFFIRAMAGG
jgi:ligand-binding sensor domain-containing protein